ncbi:MAG TPA: hypothetical protein VNO14_05120 [Blastocatellia bacterium]|nr:hypothetical protein [Blastocatellia bacterium]
MFNVARQPFGNPFINPFLSMTGLGGINPLLSQVGGFGINPLAAINPLVAAQLAGSVNPYLAAQTYTHPQVIGDPVTQAVLAQQPPIRSLTGGTHMGVPQQHIPGLTPQVGTPWIDPVTALVQAQLISQLANNPLWQLSRGFGGMETGGFGLPFGIGQQFANPLTHFPFGV